MEEIRETRMQAVSRWRECERERVELAYIAQVQPPNEIRTGRDVAGELRADVGSRLFFELGEHRAHIHFGERVKSPVDRPRAVVPDLGHEHAKRSLGPGTSGDQHARDAQLGGERRGVQGSSASVGHQREIAGVPAALDSDRPDGASHDCVGDLDDAERA